MNKILINFAHPAKARSSINRALWESVESIEGVAINDLYSQYPDFMIDVAREQALCEQHDIIVFQHPFYWYSTPSIVKEWMDLVLEHGWAFGTQGNALKDRVIFQAISAGGDADTYQTPGFNQFTNAELTSPFKGTANLCKMNWLPPFAVTGVHRGLPTEKIQQYIAEYKQVMVALQDGSLDLQVAQHQALLNNNLAQLVRGA